MSDSQVLKKVLEAEAAFPLSRAELLRILSYDGETGLFHWMERRSSNAPAGSVAGSNVRGYTNISVAGAKVRAHRLAWLYVYGEWPKGFIDHINGVRNDNRIENLRLVNFSENMQNQRKVRADSKTGLMGVQWNKRKSVFIARIKFNGKCHYLGQFPSKEAAAAAYLQAKREVHPTCSI